MSIRLCWWVLAFTWILGSSLRQESLFYFRQDRGSLCYTDFARCLTLPRIIGYWLPTLNGFSGGCAKRDQIGLRSYPAYSWFIFFSGISNFIRSLVRIVLGGLAGTFTLAWQCALVSFMSSCIAWIRISIIWAASVYCVHVLSKMICKESTYEGFCRPSTPWL